MSHVKIFNFLSQLVEISFSNVWEHWRFKWFVDLSFRGFLVQSFSDFHQLNAYLIWISPLWKSRLTNRFQIIDSCFWCFSLSWRSMSPFLLIIISFDSNHYFFVLQIFIFNPKFISYHVFHGFWWHGWLPKNNIWNICLQLIWLMTFIHVWNMESFVKLLLFSLASRSFIFWNQNVHFTKSSPKLRLDSTELLIINLAILV